MMDFIPDAQTLLIVVQGVDTGKPSYDKEKLIDAGLKCDPSHDLGAYLNFTLCLFSRSRP